MTNGQSSGKGLRCWAVLPAAGSGRRLGHDVAKQYIPIAGHPVIVWAIRRLIEEPRISGIVVVLAPDDAEWRACAPRTQGKLLITAQGGSDRSESVRNGLNALRAHAADEDWVLVHDAARPCLAASDLDRLLSDLWDDPVGGLLAIPVRDTLKLEDDASGRAARTVPRARLWQALTPQMFRYRALCDALGDAVAEGRAITDEASAMELAGLQPRLVQGRWDNFKITYPQDLMLAEKLIRAGVAT